MFFFDLNLRFFKRLLPRCKLITQIFILIIHEYFTESGALVMWFHHNLETLEDIINKLDLLICVTFQNDQPFALVTSIEKHVFSFHGCVVHLERKERFGTSKL
jgi:hypothetical protein